VGALLFAPLEYAQVAPSGFLLAEKTAVALFGSNEPALRLFPLLCALASLVLFLRVAEHALRGFALPLAVSLFALGRPFIF